MSPVPPRTPTSPPSSSSGTEISVGVVGFGFGPDLFHNDQIHYSNDLMKSDYRVDQTYLIYEHYYSKGPPLGLETVR